MPPSVVAAGVTRHRHRHRAVEGGDEVAGAVLGLDRQAKGVPAVTLVGALTTDKVSPFSTIVPTPWLFESVAASGLERVSVKVRDVVWLPLSRSGTRIVCGGDAGGERERAAGGRVIGAGDGRAVGGGVVHGTGGNVSP